MFIFVSTFIYIHTCIPPHTPRCRLVTRTCAWNPEGAPPTGREEPTGIGSRGLPPPAARRKYTPQGPVLAVWATPSATRHTYTSTYTYTHTHSHVRIHVHLHPNMYAHAYIYIYIERDTYTCVYIHTHARIHIYSYTLTYTYTCLHTCTCVYM